MLVVAAAEKARDGMAIEAEIVAPAIRVCLRESISSIRLPGIGVLFGLDAEEVTPGGEPLLSEARPIWTERLCLEKRRPA